MAGLKERKKQHRTALKQLSSLEIQLQQAQPFHIHLHWKCLHGLLQNLRNCPIHQCVVACTHTDLVQAWVADTSNKLQVRDVSKVG